MSFTGGVENPYADHTYVCNLGLHWIKGEVSRASLSTHSLPPRIFFLLAGPRRFLCYSALFICVFYMWRSRCHCLFPILLLLRHWFMIIAFPGYLHLYFGVSGYRYNFEPAHDKIYSKTCLTSKDSDQHVHPTSMARVLVHPSLDSPGAIEGTCGQRRLIRLADLSLRWSQKSYCTFCRALAYLFYWKYNYKIISIENQFWQFALFQSHLKATQTFTFVKAQ